MPPSYPPPYTVKLASVYASPVEQGGVTTTETRGEERPDGSSTVAIPGAGQSHESEGEVVHPSRTNSSARPRPDSQEMIEPLRSMTTQSFYIRRVSLSGMQSAAAVPTMPPTLTVRLSDGRSLNDRRHPMLGKGGVIGPQGDGGRQRAAVEQAVEPADPAAGKSQYHRGAGNVRRARRLTANR